LTSLLDCTILRSDRLSRAAALKEGRLA